MEDLDLYQNHDSVPNTDAVVEGSILNLAATVLEEVSGGTWEKISGRCFAHDCAAMSSYGFLLAEKTSGFWSKH